MRLVNVKTNESFAIRPHGKMPSYFETSDKRRKATIDGKEMDLVLHPKKETGNRVNFKSLTKKDEYLFVDDDALAALVRAKGNAKLEFVTREGRAPKAPTTEAQPATETKAAATSK